MKRTNVKGLLALGALTLILTSSSFGQNKTTEIAKQEQSVDDIFAEMDLDADGLLSQREVKEPLKADFAKIDLDEDKFISREELTKFLNKEGSMTPKK